MQRKTNYLAVFATVMTVLFLIAGAIAVFKPSKEVIPEGYVSQVALENAVNSEVLKVSQEKDSKISDLQNQVVDLNNKIAELNKQLAEKIEQVTEKEKEATGYLIDEVYLNSPLDEVLSDREVKTLQDSELRYDGEDYDFEEVVVLSEMEVKANEEDFEGNPYLIVPKDSVKYEVRFDTDMSTLSIDEDEPLEFTFLGEKVRVLEWKSDEVTFLMGKETLLDLGQTLDVNGKTLTLDYVMENSVYVTVDGKSREIEEGETKTVNGVEVEVKDVIYSEVGPVTKAVLVTGEEVRVSVKSGDEFEEDSIWNYVVTPNSLGIVLNDEFKELDDELKPLAPGESICLPNDYVCVRYDGFVDEDFEEITFELEDGFVEINGKFQAGLDDFDKLLVNSTGVYDEDEVAVNGKILIDDSDVELVVDNTNSLITIEGFSVNFDLTDSSVGASKDDPIRTSFGILVENPEDSAEDQEWTISVPYEKLESTVTVM